MSSDFVPFRRRPAPALLPKNAEVHDLKLPDLASGKAPSYQKIKSTFRPDITAKDSRFMLSELVANQLSVEAEEQLRFDKRVNEVVEAKLVEIREGAYRDGHAEGLEVGKKEAYEQEKLRLAQQIESLASLLDTLTKAKANLAAQYEKSLVEMAFRLAKVIVHHEVTSRPDSIWHTIEAILTKIAKEDDVRVRLSAQQFEAIEGIQEQVATLTRAGRISFEVDQRLPVGACVVESLSGEISSVIDEKFEKLKHEIEKGLKPVSDVEGTGT
jgi:flagellar assembly protein FliH